uniref:Pre-mRNA-splicing factor CWC26 n=1 Tax=Peronospora matthiolae TaxID=2874970 RepID=A0AAV1VPQ2_9STRA
MTSKVEYLRRYLSSASSDAVDGEKKKKKRKKVRHSKDATRGTHVVDADDAWESSAPHRDKIERKWELDAVEDELPLVVALVGDEDPVDAQDLPVYVDSGKYLDDYQGKKKAEKQVDDGDLSPPRKKGGEGRRRNDESDDEIPPVRKSKKKDGASPRYRSGDDFVTSELERGAFRDESVENVSLRTKARSKQSSKSKEEVEDASPPRRSTRVKRDDDASPPRRRRRSSTLLRRSRDDDEEEQGRKHYNRDDDGESKAESSRTRNSSVEKTTKNALLPKESHHIDEGLKRDEQKRRHLPSSSPSAPDRQRRVDSLGRDIPPRSDRDSISRDNDASSKCHKNNTTNRRSRSQNRGRVSDHYRKRDSDRDQSAHTSRPRRKSRSRSRLPRARHHRDSRSPSVRVARSPERVKRLDSHGRNGRHHSQSMDRSHSRSRGSKQRSTQHVSVAAREKKLSDEHNGRTGSRTGNITSPTPDGAKSASRKVTSHSNEKKESQVESLNEKEVKRAGLFTAAEFDRQREIAAKLKDSLHAADASEMGANAETVYRDKRGRKLDMLNEIVRQQEVLDGKRKREEREEYEWGTGEVQKRERKSKQELVEQMKKTPFARHEDDEELERKRRERVRAFDPMHSKIFQENSLNTHTAAKAKKSKMGTKKAIKVKPKYTGPPAPPNRFGIVPGYRWDGVVRGTNWEEKIMMRQNANAAGRRRSLQVCSC